LIYLGIFRIILGIGVGGDYPMSASITSDRASIRKRGVLLSYIFSNQGWGSLVGSLATIIVLACYKHVMNDLGQTSKVDGGRSMFQIHRQTKSDIELVWRIVVGLSLIPAFGTLYQRLTLPESTRFEDSKRLQDTENIEDLKNAQKNADGISTPSATSQNAPEVIVKKKAHITGASHVFLCQECLWYSYA
jgi:MFS transporter, PHS family, inorganic phosphate transporter